MKIALLAGLICPLSLLAQSLPQAAPKQIGLSSDAQQVRVAQGIVRGLVNDGVAIFRSIPYAAPPIGPLRFGPPEPPRAWTGLREAVQDGPSCPQPSSPDPAGKASTTEDCLYLNVFAPAAKSALKRPVIVWLHGGAWSWGFSGARQYDPASLVKEGGIVVVSINYRLGTLGLLATRSLDEADGAPSGNYLIRDQQAALRWIQRNIAAFGGDPGNVTLSGESAGANSTLALVTSPLSEGLFQKAIVQSGVDDAHTLSRSSMEQAGGELAEALGCATGAKQAECLRGLPVESILKVQRKLGIVEDPQLFPLDPFVAYREGKFNRVPMIIGSNLHEGYFFVYAEEKKLGHPLTEAEYVAAMKNTFGKDSDAAMRAYPSAIASSPSAAFGDAVTDIRFACYMDMARAGARFTSVYGYEMNEPDPLQEQPRSSSLGNTSYHTSDLGYLFNYGASGPPTGAAAELGRRLRAYWIQFARTGSPDQQGLPVWPRFQPQSHRVLNLSNSDGVTTDFAARHHCGPVMQAGLVSGEGPISVTRVRFP